MLRSDVTGSVVLAGEAVFMSAEKCRDMKTC